jgi:hypothetical protein
MALSIRYVKTTVVSKNNEVQIILNDNSKGARIDFDITRKTPTFQNGFSTAEIKIYNLSFKNFVFLRDKGKSIQLEAGHRNTTDKNNGVCFLGFIYSVMRTKIDTNIVTILYCSTLDIKNTEIRKPLKDYSLKQIDLYSLLLKISSDIGLTLITNCSNFKNVILTDVSFKDNALVTLEYLAQKYEFIYDINGKTLLVSLIEETKTKVFEINRATGLLKPPIITEKGVDLEVFLMPQIQPQDLFNLSTQYASFNLGALEFQDRPSSKINIGNIRSTDLTDTNIYVGQFRVLFLNHTGSTHTNQWSTRIEGCIKGVQ